MAVNEKTAGSKDNPIKKDAAVNKGAAANIEPPIINLSIDGREVTGRQGQTILDIARENGIGIPTLCHDDRVKIYGSCGLCIVEAEGNPKLLRSCSTFAAKDMIIHTNSERIYQNRKAALELMISDHTGDCRPPCTLACPAQTDCQGYVGLIANGAYNEAYELIKEKIPLPASIGRVCPHPCEEACRRELVEEPISILALKQFASDKQHLKGEIYTAKVKPPTGKSVAVVGGGPGGLSAAYFLRTFGHDVVVYDAMPLMGGMLRYGIPEYRLPKKVLQEEIDAIEGMGVSFHNNVRIGEDISLDHLRETFDAVVIAIGAWSSMGMGCPGEELDGVHGGIEFLWNITGITPKLLRRKVAIVGGGNTAMDACRTAVRSGASVIYNVYRRTRNEMPAEETEIAEAEEEGVIFKNLTNPIEIIGANGRVESMRLQIMELGEPDKSGRRRPVPVPGKEESIEVDTVIVAIGQKPVTLGFEGVEQTKWSTIIADEHTFRTNIEGVFAVGDVSNNGADIAITAIGEAQRAAGMIHKYLCGRPLKYEAPFLVKTEKTEEDFAGTEKQARAKMPQRSASDRKKDFLEINFGFSDEEAKREASRCLECGCIDFFECKLVGYAGQYGVRQEKYGGMMHKRAREEDHPFIRRNQDKCILCGLCVRICEEVSGATALGIMDRGFDAMVMPAFDSDLRDTDCINCGQCVYVCPTGALTEMMMVPKQVPLKEKYTETVCSFCSIGCKTSLTSVGNLLLRCLPSSADRRSLLCKRGRFGFGDIGKKERLTVPLIRRGSGLEEASFEQAINFVNKSLRDLQAKFGNNCVAVSMSDRYTNEEAYLIKDYANRILKTDSVFSFGKTESGLPGVLGCDASTASLDELEDAELIVVVAPGSDINLSVAAMRIRCAVTKGAKLLLLDSTPAEFGDSSGGGDNDGGGGNGGGGSGGNGGGGGSGGNGGGGGEGADDDGSGLLYDIADMRIDMGDELTCLEQINRLLLDRGCGAGIEGRDELLASLKDITDVTVCDKARTAADMIINAKSAVFVFEKNRVTVQAARLIANIAALSGHAGCLCGSCASGSLDSSGCDADLDSSNSGVDTISSGSGVVSISSASGGRPHDSTGAVHDPGNGVIQILPGANSQGLINLGVKSGVELFRAVADGEVRGLFIFGEEIGGLDLRAVEFMAVQDLHMTEAARQANVVLPASYYTESDGSYTASDNKTQELKPAVKSPVAWDNIRQIAELAIDANDPATVPVPTLYQNAAEVRKAMACTREPGADTKKGPNLKPDRSVRLAVAKKGALRNTCSFNKDG